MATALIQTTEAGLYCEAGDFFIDPWRPVARAVVTHGHSDHARRGSAHYLAARGSEAILRTRLGEDISLQTVPYGEPVMMNGVRVSLHPAGHLLGSAQVRVEHRGEVWVASGDYKVQPDRTCEPFEPVRCDVFITESTFGLPIYCWDSQDKVFAQIGDWWRGNQERGWTSVLLTYALGKAQRILANIDAGIGPILVHGTIPPLNAAYAAGGVKLPDCLYASLENAKTTNRRALVLAPPSAGASPWLRKFTPYSLAMASGWMQIRGTRRRRSMDRGFALSDHADWPGLMQAIRATGAHTIGVTHGYTRTMARWLGENGYRAWELKTEYAGELEEGGELAESETPAEPVAEDQP